MHRCLSNRKVTGFSHCALPPEGASGLPWSCTILLAHCLTTTWWHWQLAQQLAIFQGHGRYGSWWLVNSVPALCAQAYVQTPLAVLLLEPPASSEQRLDLKSPPPVTIAITWAFMLKTALWQENVCVPPECEARFMVFKIHELRGMERSFSEYRKETERLCLHDTQAVGHLRQEKFSQTNYLAWYRPLSFPSQKRL